ncbi:serine/threonine-protein kinase [Streptomyces sp. NPDC052225]|uniref:serine/threonine-protein kinase n=1 Tax=Streptomyces sp. NPDC052225 TaxID=3154949 RepID=UPI003417317E
MRHIPEPGDSIPMDKAAWTLGDRIGQGGFGLVFRARRADGATGAVKLIEKAPGADRELLLGRTLAGSPYVVPVLDAGETEDHWALAMPLADTSLDERVARQGGRPLPLADALAVLRDIAAALADLDGRVVHRDLKPANILLLNGSWRLADFGISRYAQASTDPNTRKHSLTPPYASPEQWRGEHATGAADIYATGVIAFELLTGSRPFPGPQPPDYRRQHLSDPLPPLPDEVPAELAALVKESLFKPAGARPTADDLRARLDRIDRARSSKRA